jgi:plastocyanin
MRKIFPIILILLFAAFSGCLGSKNADENAQSETQRFELANPHLDARIVDVKLSPADVRAGEEVTADLIIANVGIEKITNETIDIKAKVNTLEDFVGNLALKVLSEDKKTKTFTISFDEEIKPGIVKPLSAVFHTVQEMQGRNLAGTYSVTITLSVNGQKVESKVVPIALSSGKPREPNEKKPIATPAATVTAEPTTSLVPSITDTPLSTPTPKPTPEAVTVKPSGIIHVTRITGYKFGEPKVTMDAGDTLQWYNLDDDIMTMVEVDGKMDNISVNSRKNIIFNTTGKYTFKMYYPQMRQEPPLQAINIILNQSR